MRRLKATLEQVLEAGRRLADSDLLSALITGETGTGKELVARALHFGGAAPAAVRRAQLRADPGARCSRASCSATSAAPSPARARARPGCSSAAHGGTLFLDEIGELAARAAGQAAARARGRKRCAASAAPRELRGRRARRRRDQPRPRGSWSRAAASARISTTGCACVQLAVPPLRERARATSRCSRATSCERFARALRQRRAARSSPEAEAALRGYAWPGNVRELRNVIEEAVLLAQDDVISQQQLSFCASLGDVHLSGEAQSVVPDIPDGGINLEDVERGLRAPGAAEGRVERHAGGAAPRSHARHAALPHGEVQPCRTAEAARRRRRRRGERLNAVGFGTQQRAPEARLKRAPPRAAATPGGSSRPAP